jgi:hypothetical protein
MDQQLPEGRRPERIASHPIFSADRESVNNDARFENKCFAGDKP